MDRLIGLEKTQLHQVVDHKLNARVYYPKPASGSDSASDKSTVYFHGGDSAGEYLACLVSLKSLQNDLKEKSLYTPSFQFLIYPMLNLKGGSKSYNAFTKNVFTNIRL